MLNPTLIHQNADERVKQLREEASDRSKLKGGSKAIQLTQLLFWLKQSKLQKNIEFNTQQKVYS